MYRFFVIQHTLDRFDLAPFASQNLEERVLRMAIYPKEKEKEVIDSVPMSINLHPKNFTDFLSVVFLEEQCYVGFAPKELFFYPGVFVEDTLLAHLSLTARWDLLRKCNPLGGESKEYLSCALQAARGPGKSKG